MAEIKKALGPAAVGSDDDEVSEKLVIPSCTLTHNF